MNAHTAPNGWRAEELRECEPGDPTPGGGGEQSWSSSARQDPFVAGHGRS
jgi:hypothetical protein